MDTADIERMAREASGSGDELIGDAISRFAALVRAQAMEEAAQIAEKLPNARFAVMLPHLRSRSGALTITDCAAAIRSAAQKERAEAALQRMADDAQRLGLGYEEGKE